MLSPSDIEAVWVVSGALVGAVIVWALAAVAVAFIDASTYEPAVYEDDSFYDDEEEYEYEEEYEGEHV